MDEKSESLEKEANNGLSARKITGDVVLEVAPSAVDSDKNSSDLNLPARYPKFRENVNKRKRPRRKSKKGKYPYSKSSWLQRGEQSSSKRALRVRQQMFTHGQPVAPYNTTQFLIEDHGDLQNIDAQLQVAQDHGNSISTNRPSRARDSSFSIDSDEDYFYSSPEDEEEFLTKEFSSAYEDLHVERLSSMSKSEIIHDYLQLEAKYEKSLLELKRLKGEAGDDSIQIQENEGDGEKEDEDRDRDTDASSKSENEIAEQLRVSQLENKSLKVELEELRKENKTLRNLVEKNQSSSVDSESDSSSTSSLSSSDSSSDSELDDDDMNSHNECKMLDLNDTNVTNRDYKSVEELNGICENGCMSEEDSEVRKVDQDKS